MCCLLVLAWFRPLIWTLCLRSGAQPLWDSVASRVRQRFTWRKTEVYQSEYTLQTVNGIPVSSLVYLFVSTLLVGHRVWSENKLYVNIGTKGLLSADLRPLRIFGPGNLPAHWIWGSTSGVKSWNIQMLRLAQYIELIHKSQNATVLYPTMLHSEQKCAHFCSEWSIVGYGTGAFWDLWNWSIGRTCQNLYW